MPILPPYNSHKHMQQNNSNNNKFAQQQQQPMRQYRSSSNTNIADHYQSPSKQTLWDIMDSWEGEQLFINIHMRNHACSMIVSVSSVLHHNRHNNYINEGLSKYQKDNKPIYRHNSHSNNSHNNNNGRNSNNKLFLQSDEYVFRANSPSPIYNNDNNNRKTGLDMAGLINQYTSRRKSYDMQSSNQQHIDRSSSNGNSNSNRHNKQNKQQNRRKYSFNFPSSSSSRKLSYDNTVNTDRRQQQSATAAHRIVSQPCHKPINLPSNNLFSNNSPKYDSHIEQSLQSIKQIKLPVIDSAHYSQKMAGVFDKFEDMKQNILHKITKKIEAGDQYLKGQLDNILNELKLAADTIISKYQIQHHTHKTNNRGNAGDVEQSEGKFMVPNTVLKQQQSYQQQQLRLKRNLFSFKDNQPQKQYTNAYSITAKGNINNKHNNSNNNKHNNVDKQHEQLQQQIWQSSCSAIKLPEFRDDSKSISSIMSDNIQHSHLYNCNASVANDGCANNIANCESTKHPKTMNQYLIHIIDNDDGSDNVVKLANNSTIQMQGLNKRDHINKVTMNKEDSVTTVIDNIKNVRSVKDIGINLTDIVDKLKNSNVNIDKAVHDSKVKVNDYKATAIITTNYMKGAHSQNTSNNTSNNTNNNTSNNTSNNISNNIINNTNNNNAVNEVKMQRVNNTKTDSEAGINIDMNVGKYAYNGSNRNYIKYSDYYNTIINKDTKHATKEYSKNPQVGNAENQGINTNTVINTNTNATIVNKYANTAATATANNNNNMRFIRKEQVVHHLVQQQIIDRQSNSIEF